MAFEDNGDEELDYENEDLLDNSLPGVAGHPAMHGLNEEQLEDEDYEDLYGDVNVGMFQGLPAGQTASAFRNSAQNGAPSYGDIDSGNEDDYPIAEGAEEQKADLGETGEEGLNSLRTGIVPFTRPQDKSVEYALRVKQENLYGEQEAGPSSLKPKDESEAGVGQPARPTSAPKSGKSTGGPNGTGGIEGGAGRGLQLEGAPPGGWPLGSGPAGAGGNVVGGANSNVASEYTAKHTGQAPDTGGLMLFVGELQWWTTDAELEAALSEYGRVKNLKFFEEKASGKSKGYCQVEFFDSQAARVCKEKMDGRVFNGRACVVAFASPQTIKQMGAAQIGKNQGMQGQGQAGQGKKAAEGGRGAGAAGPGGDGRGFNKGRGGQVGMERGRGNQGGPGRGRGRGMAPFGPQGPMGGPPGGMMPPQGMMGQGFEPGFGPPMGRGGGYGMGPGGGGFGPRGPPFSGMGPPFPPMGPGLPGVPAHVNPAFFGRGNGNGPGMGPGGMEGPPGGWGEVGMPGWEEHERRMREGGYAGEDMGGAEFGYGGGGEIGRVGPGRERERGAGDGEWGPERRRREERGGERGEDWERGERHRTGEREGYREPRGERSEREKEKDWDRAERPASRAPREKEDDRVRSREDDHGKRRRMATDRKSER